MVLRTLLVMSALAMTACAKGGNGGSVTINPPPTEDVCVESSQGLFKAKHDSNGNHYGWCQLDNPHYDPAQCDDSPPQGDDESTQPDPVVVDDPGEDAVETECPR